VLVVVLTEAETRWDIREAASNVEPPKLKTGCTRLCV
jgi:hypothetical protein